MRGLLADYRYDAHVEGHAHKYIMPALLKMLGPPSGPILDLGCGAGWIAMDLLARGYEVYGVDGSESGIAIARERHPDAFFRMNVEDERLPSELQDKGFAVVISTEVIEHLYNPRAFIRLARNVLIQSGGGRFILSTPYHGYLKNLALALAGKFDDHHTVLWDGGHIKFFSRSTLERMLREQQFHITGFAGAGRAPFLWKSMVMSASLTPH
jgi:2-polyprenyl-3-methyl-5-hydroxy-6-metoxy-1,4-benzoquinol methylase